MVGDCMIFNYFKANMFVRYPDFSKELLYKGVADKTTETYTAQKDVWVRVSDRANNAVVQIDGTELSTGNLFTPLKKGHTISITKSGTSAYSISFRIYGTL